MSRKASHAGSWYSSSGNELNKELEGWLKVPGISVSNPVRAIIAPHAGYTYCGSCAAFAYKQINPENIKRVFILGPSHHVYMDDCALTSAKTYQTPINPLTIDHEMNQELRTTRMFSEMSVQTDEDEHSIEMHLPYIAKIMEKNQNFKIVPILVGSLGRDSEIAYGKLLSKYLADPENLFVISSDFCHWGQRFRYVYYDDSKGQIYQSIEHLDRHGMELIENLDAKEFHNYLKKFRNTICGRHPIAVLLNAVGELKQVNNRSIKFRFLDYKQSSKCRNKNDSSVSYAAGVLEMS